MMTQDSKASPSTSAERRERIARIIDPSMWSVADEAHAKGFHVFAIGLCVESLAKADAILSSDLVGMDQKKSTAQSDHQTEQSAHVPSLTPWEEAVEPICREVGSRVGSVAREVADNIYTEIMETVQDYLAENVTYNLASELSMLRRSNGDLRKSQTKHDDLVWTLRRLLKIIDSGTYRDGTHLCISAHPAVDSARAMLDSASESSS